MASLQDLLAQRAELEQQIAAMQSQARTEAIAKIRVIMAEHGLTAADLSSRQTAPKGASPEVKRVAPVKYRDASGNSWSGRGLKPKWLSAALAGGKQLEDFAV